MRLGNFFSGIFSRQTDFKTRFLNNLPAFVCRGNRFINHMRFNRRIFLRRIFSEKLRNILLRPRVGRNLHRRNVGFRGCCHLLTRRQICPVSGNDCRCLICGNLHIFILIFRSFRQFFAFSQFDIFVFIFLIGRIRRLICCFFDHNCPL